MVLIQFLVILEEQFFQFTMHYLKIIKLSIFWLGTNKLLFMQLKVMLGQLEKLDVFW